MPLDSGPKEELFAKLIGSGHSEKEAKAIVSAMDYVDSQRRFDFNGWYEIKGNPLSRAGVFPYPGSSLGPEYDPNRVYQVLRPEEELAHPECIESFKLLPWIDDHVMLGPDGTGFTAPEAKGIQGVIGEEIYFQEGILYGNIKVFSNLLANLIEAGKKQLSAGYRCFYEKAEGVWNGIKYDAIQRKIRGNHLALVAEGRMGPEVAVLDHFNFTLDAKDIHMADEENGGEKEMTLAEIATELKRVMPQIKALQDVVAKMNPASEVDPANGGVGTDEDEDKDKDDKDKKEKESMDAAFKAEVKTALDGAIATVGELAKKVDGLIANGTKTILGEVAERDALAEKISAHVGTFDHKDKTLAEVASYGVEKLGLKCPAGQEKIALDGFFHDRKSPSAQPSVALDGKVQGSELTEYLAGKKE